MVSVGEEETKTQPTSVPLLRGIQARFQKKPYNYVVIDPTKRNITGDGLSDVVQNLQFSLDAVPFFTQLSGNYQYYRFQRVEVVYKPYITSVVAFGGEGASTFVTPDVAFCTNTSSIPLSSYAQVQQRADATVCSSTEFWRHSFLPVPLVRAFDSLTSDGFLNLGQQWIETNRTDVPHYGMSLAIEPSDTASAAPSFGGRLEVYIYMQFKCPLSNTPGVGVSTLDRRRR